MNRNRKTPVLAGLIFFAGCVTTASAGFVVPSTPTWTRPTSTVQASSSLTTYQAWNGFDSTKPPAFHNPANDPNSVNPNGTAVAFDNGPSTDGAFFAGSDIYSFSGVIQPEVIVPEYTVTGQQLKVFVEVQYFGSDINLNDLLVTYIDSNNVQQAVQASTLAGYSVNNLYSLSTVTGFGPADTADYTWSFTIPNTSSFQLDWGWDVVSSALQNVSVDTQSVPVPEPVSASLLTMCAVSLFRRSRGR